MFAVNEVRALGDLVVIGLAGLRLRLSRVHSLTGGLCGIGGHNDSPVSRPIRSVSGGEPAASLLYRGPHAFRSRQRPSTHVDAGRLGGDRDLLTCRGVATRARLARRLDPDRQLDQAANAAIQADNRFGRGAASGRAIASARPSTTSRPGGGSHRRASGRARRASAFLSEQAPMLVRPDRCVGFELDDVVFELTRKNLSLVSLEIDLIHEGYESGLNALRIPDDHLVVLLSLRLGEGRWTWKPVWTSAARRLPSPRLSISRSESFAGTSCCSRSRRMRTSSRVHSPS